MQNATDDLLRLLKKMRGAEYQVRAIARNANISIIIVVDSLPFRQITFQEDYAHTSVRLMKGFSIYGQSLSTPFISSYLFAIGYSMKNIAVEDLVRYIDCFSKSALLSLA